MKGLLGQPGAGALLADLVPLPEFLATPGPPCGTGEDRGIVIDFAARP